MSGDNWTAVGVVLALGGTALNFARAWRKRERDAAAAPFLAGHEAVEAAKDALDLRKAELAELRGQREKLQQDLAQALADNRAQATQITDLYVKLGTANGDNAALQRQADLAREREEHDRARIAELEASVLDLRKQLGMGIP